MSGLSDTPGLRQIGEEACARYVDWYSDGSKINAGEMAYDLVSAIRQMLHVHAQPSEIAPRPGELPGGFEELFRKSLNEKPGVAEICEMQRPSSAIESTPTRGAVLLLDGKAYRMCACRSDTPLCPKGRERKCPSAGYDHCLIPVCSTHGIFIDVMGCKQCDPEYP